MNKEQAMQKAQELIAKYPDCKNVSDLIDTAVAHNEFKTNEEGMAVWGRVCRLLPQKN
jgi:hypothetical protein